MSAREWRPSPDGIGSNTGDSFKTGAGYVYPNQHGRWTATADFGRVHMSDPTPKNEAEARRVSEEWLDENEAEAQQAQKGGTT